jgi:hypothetical protein
VQLLQELHSDDTDKQNEFCESFLQQDNAINDMCSDEVMFQLSVNVYGYNSCYWAHKNPRWNEAPQVQNDTCVMM